MKKVLGFALVTAAAFSAQALESHYGQVKQRGLNYSCSFHNNTGVALNMKYVAFTVQPITGDSHSYDIQERIDRVVDRGETITASADIPTNVQVQVCKFQAR